ncbi:hypothetical protein BDV25DRAFT_136985 [Aspergillus avenaceus]|uniref:Fe2OG dioxygenase domain-containing protein n=1 Tax=Aspergillus avenaceus TaxID=36643 RepID=A0A5N6U419_ASPAV|nr:hypothetical protein BDV25DRAFT_136985 [Aspergillus avenaceus]
MKRINTYFKSLSPPPKRQKPDTSLPPSTTSTTWHEGYPFPIPDLPGDISDALSEGCGLTPPKTITNHPHLDLLYFQPLIPGNTARELFLFLREELPFYRVKYTIRRGTQETSITTPRFTTVFGVDETSRFSSEVDTSVSSAKLVDFKTNNVIPSTKYKCTPRPIPNCLRPLLDLVTRLTGMDYNFILVNYYATGDDSISYHSDDERFLGPDPTIASLSLGGKRDFLLKHKPGVQAGPLKFPLASGDMVVMRGETQKNWLHSVPKRKEAGGRINITFRKALVPGGTENYYRYNVGDGGVWRWKSDVGEMAAVE